MALVKKWTTRLAVHCLYDGRHRQHRCRGTEKYTPWGGLLALLSPALLLFTGLYLFRAAVCHQSGAAGDAPTEQAPAALLRGNILLADTMAEKANWVPVSRVLREKWAAARLAAKAYQTADGRMSGCDGSHLVLVK